MQISTKIWYWGARMLVSLGGRTVAMLFIALAIAFGTVIFSDNWIVAISKQVEQTRKVLENVSALHQLKTNLFQAESAQRGYIITKRLEYLAPFRDSIEQARKNIKLSESKVGEIYPLKNQSMQLDLLKKITASVEAKSLEMMLTIKLVEQNKMKEANSVVNLDVGWLEMQKFVAETDNLINMQTADVNVMIKKRQDKVTMARASVIGGTLVLILLVVMVIKQLLSELAAKAHLQQLVIKENTNYDLKLKQQTMLLRSLALEHQADVEHERQKLSRELHDELGSIFTATKMDLAWSIKKLANIAPDISEKLIKTTNYVDQGIQFQRHIVQELHPSMISTFGFWPALNALIKDTSERNKWRLTLNLPPETVSINETISLIIYRIVQESLNNASKYAKASAVNVDVMLDDNHLKLEISDDGIGFDMQSLNNSTRGFSGMRNRVLAIGGSFDIVSQPSQGTLIRALIPIDIVAKNVVDIESRPNLQSSINEHLLNS